MARIELSNIGGGGGTTLSLTTTGTSGAATLAGSVLNIPIYQGQLTLTTTGTSGAATLSGDILNIPQYSGGGTPAGSAGQVQFNSTPAGAFAASANLAWDNSNVRLNIGAPSSPTGTLNIKGASATATQNTSITNSSNLAIFSALNDQTVGIGTSAPSNTLTVRATTATINTELPSFSHNYINTIYSRPNSNASLAPYSSSVGGMIFTGIGRTNTPSVLFLGATNDTATATMAPVVFCGLRRNSANNNTTAVASGELCVSFYNGATGFDIGTRLASFFGDGSLLISSGASSSAKLHVIGTNTTANVGTFLVQDGAATPATIYRIDNDGKITYRATNTAAGTTGAQTINRPSGTVNFAIGASSLVVTNSLCTTASLVFAEVRTNDATAQIKNVVPAAGSFTINLSAAATAETSVGFFIIN